MMGERRREKRSAVHYIASTIVIIFGCTAAMHARAALAQDDDWSVVSHEMTHRPQPSAAAPSAPEPDAAAQEGEASAEGARMICGEMARPASEPYKSVVAELNREWGTNTPVYESVRPGSPHVSRGGCIFYNSTFMEVFLRGETDEHGVPDKTSMTYAIMAHELGHIVHNDYERDASSVTKELEADRFSGYTLSRLGIARGNITPFYSLGGDEFSGVHDHGFSNQRIAAFDLGWKRAEWNQPENGGAAARNSAATVSAADDSSESDDSSAAAAVP